MPVMRLGWGCRQQLENVGTGPSVPVQGMGWGQGLTDGEEGSVLETEKGELVSRPHLATNDHLSMEFTHKDSMRELLCS